MERTKKLSVIPVPVQISVKDLQTIINNNISGLLYEDSTFDADNLLIKVWKESDIKLAVSGNEFYYDVPLKVWVKGKYELKQLGIGLSQTKEADFKLKLKFKSVISLSPDWQLITHTVGLGHEWLTPPVIKVGFIEIPFKRLADKVINDQQKYLAKIIDAKVKEDLEIKSYAKDVWEKIQEPLQIQQDPDVWLKLQPTEVGITQLGGEGEWIKTTLLLKAYSDIKFGLKQTAPLVELPALNKSSLSEEDFYLSFDSEISYLDLTEMANQYFRGKVFEFRNGKKKVMIDKVNIYGSGNKLIFDLAVSGDIAGKMYLTSLPYYDSLSQSLGLKDVDFDLDTKNQILKTASWLAQGTIQKKIETNLRYSVTEDIKQVQELIAKELSDRKIADFLYIKAEVKEIIPREVFLTQESLKIIIDSKGSLNLFLKN
ncbi:MAG TPA: DUF4403 family protein [Cytophagaceae bacterium]